MKIMEQHQPNNIYLGDCVQLMSQIPDNSIDFILTDPPYLLDNHGGGQSSLSSRKLSSCHIDFISNGFDYDIVFNEFLRITKIPNFVIFCSNKQVSDIMSWFERKQLSVTLLVWHKTNPIPFANGKHLSDVEFVVYVRGKNSTFNNDVPYEYKSKVYTTSVVSSKERLHPTEKPISLLQKYIELFTKENDVILDPFCGSASTCVAAIRTKRRYIGFELSEEYFNVSKQRIAKETEQLKLF